MEIAIIQDNENPQKSANTDLIGSWLTAGGQLVRNGGYQDYEKDGKRNVIWLVDLSVKAEIDDEMIDFKTFRERFENIEWCKAHPKSDISWMRAFRDNLRDLKRFAKTVTTGICKTEGMQTGVVYPNSPEWLKQEFATRFL